MTPAYLGVCGFGAGVARVIDQRSGTESSANGLARRGEPSSGMAKLALVHDYLTQRGGAERVLLALEAAFPGSPIYTSLYEPNSTYQEFRHLDVRALGMNQVALLRRWHRLALPFLASAFSHLEVDSEITLCSSSGWAHGARALGRKIVYCYAPARWLYQASRYSRGRAGVALSSVAFGPALRKWDRAAAITADRYLVVSRAVQRQVEAIYGIRAEVLPPPVNLSCDGPQREVPHLDAGFWLCVSRLLPYKNVDMVVEAFRNLPGECLVIAGQGPCAARLSAKAGDNVVMLGEVDDATLRWLYRSCRGLIAASYEDFGLTPVEAASYGKPSAVLRWGGFLDTVREGETGVYFDAPEPLDISEAVRRLERERWDEQRLVSHAELFSPERFAERMHAVIQEELALVG